MILDLGFLLQHPASSIDGLPRPEHGMIISRGRFRDENRLGCTCEDLPIRPCTGKERGKYRIWGVSRGCSSYHNYITDCATVSVTVSVTDCVTISVTVSVTVSVTDCATVSVTISVTVSVAVSVTVTTYL